MPLSFVHRELILDLSIDGIKSYRLTTFPRKRHMAGHHTSIVRKGNGGGLTGGDLDQVIRKQPAGKTTATNCKLYVAKCSFLVIQLHQLGHGEVNGSSKD